MAQSTTAAVFRNILTIASSITKNTEEYVLATSERGSLGLSATQTEQFSLPPSLTPQLTALGLPHDISEHISAAYLLKAEELKKSTVDVIGPAYAKLMVLPRSESSLPADSFRRQFLEAHILTYHRTLQQWAQQALDLARSRLNSIASDGQLSPHAPEVMPSKSSRPSNRQFRSEYLPLFEFAFEKDRFPSREDKKYLARISSMSYRQVCVWFQNRRCRQASRIKSHRITSAPKTFEEMKERLGPSAREALSEPLPFVEKLNPDTTDRATTEEPVPAQDAPKLPPSAPEVIVLDDEPEPSSSTRAVSLEATDRPMSPASSGRATSLEATDDGYESDDCDDPVEDDFLKIPVYELPVLDEEPTPPPQKLHPLNPFKTSVHAFPAVYEPSQLTSDPFVVEHHPWLRDPRTHSRKFIDPTPEAMEDIMGGFGRMDVDEPDAKTTNDQFSSRRSISRNVSSGSIGMWSSGESTIGSHASPSSSSAQSSPRTLEADLPTMNEGAVEAELDSLLSTERTTSLVAEDASETDADTEAEAVCDLPEAEEGVTAGSSAALVKSRQDMGTRTTSAEEDVDAWALESIALQAKPPTATLKWQNLLAVAAQCDPVKINN